MKPVTPNQRFAVLILQEMCSVLKPAGFTKRAKTFVRSPSDVIQFVNLQSSVSSTRNFVKVTVNLSVFSCLLADLLSEDEITARPGVCVSHWLQRIGYFMSERNDYWWRINTDEEAAAAGKQIAQVLAEHGLPMLDKLSSTAELKALWESGKGGGISRLQKERYLAALNPQKE